MLDIKATRMELYGRSIESTGLLYVIVRNRLAHGQLRCDGNAFRKGGLNRYHFVRTRPELRKRKTANFWVNRGSRPVGPGAKPLVVCTGLSKEGLVGNCDGFRWKNVHSSTPQEKKAV
jgi:hypothetical protein